MFKLLTFDQSCYVTLEARRCCAKLDPTGQHIRRKLRAAQTICFDRSALEHHAEYSVQLLLMVGDA